MIGSPDPAINEAMQREHTDSADSTDEFVTTNYKVRTTPKTEWRFVANPELLNGEWPKEDRTLDEFVRTPERMRSTMPSREVEAKLKSVNEQLRAIGADLLLLEEALGARLYTGPMCVRLLKSSHCALEASPQLAPRVRAGLSSTTPRCVGFRQTCWLGARATSM